MKLLMISHLLGDFYFQTDSMSENKKTSCRPLVLHVIIYTLTVFCMYALATGRYQEYTGTVFWLGVFHFVIDYGKIEIEKRCKNQNKYALLLLAVEQIFHLVILWTFRQIFPFEINFRYLSFFPIYLLGEVGEILTWSIAVLLCGKPAAIFVGMVFKSIPQTIQSAEKRENKESNEAGQSESLKIGSWIGILEREIILILGLLEQYGAIGFVLTAKSLARHSQLNNRAFAEKYLVGTLLSAFIALLCVAMCKWFI
mgnify:CR=1 FL=1